MKTYENYYGMTFDSNPEQCRAVIDTSFDPIMAIMFEKQDEEDLKTLDYKERARTFFRKGGLTDEEIDEMAKVFAGGQNF